MVVTATCSHLASLRVACYAYHQNCLLQSLVMGHTIGTDRSYVMLTVYILSIQCHRGRSLDAFFDGIQSDPVKLAVVGCGCSIATEPVAEISHQWNISQVASVIVN